MAEILFVHGALVRDGGWWWRQVAALVEASTGVRSRALELPSCGEADVVAGEAGLLEDAAALQTALAASGPDGAIVVGHSYGGTVIAEGADHPGARHLVLISSYLPHVGSSQSDIMSSEADPVRVAAGVDGTLRVDGYTEAAFGERFWQDVDDPGIRSGAWQRITPQGIGAFTTPTTRAAWQGRESTALVCADDRSTSVALQREHAARATRAVELPTGHHPFLSRPDLVAEQLESVIRGL